MRLPECLLFDLDGTILDSLPGVEYSVKAAFDSCGLTLRDGNLRRMIGPPIRTILAAAGGGNDREVLDRLERAFRKSYDSEGWEKTVCFPDAHRALRTMHSHGHRLFVVSNKPRHISLRSLEREGMIDLFEEIVTADSRTPAFSGKAEMIESLMAAHRMVPADCLMVGDTMEDAGAAATAGVKFVYMTHGYGDVVETHSLPIAFKLDGFSQFLPLVTQEPVCD
jgi:phosphoglycolate phosphatase